MNYTTGDTQYEVPTADQALPPQLPAGWEEAASRSSGDTYYVNHATGQTQYDFPTAQDEQEEQPADVALAHPWVNVV